MAARKTILNERQKQNVRDHIQTTKLIKRLHGFALGENEINSKKKEIPIEIDPARLKAIEILLRKSLPDLTSVDMNHGVQEDNPIASLLKDIANNGKRVTKDG